MRPITKQTQKIKKTVDAEGNTISADISIDNETINKGASEPDYVKIYTDMWCNLQGVTKPNERDVFLGLAKGMNYTSMASTSTVANSQVVCCTGPLRDEICERLNIKQKTFANILTALCKAGAIKHTKWPGFYRLNPNFAGKGAWRYNSQLAQGGLQALRLCWDLELSDPQVAGKYVAKSNWQAELKFADGGDNSETADVTGLAPGQDYIAISGRDKSPLTPEEEGMLSAEAEKMLDEIDEEGVS